MLLEGDRPARPDRLRVVRDDPICAETRLDRQVGLLTPTDAFFARNNFPFPEPPAELAVDGLVDHPGVFPPAALADLPAAELVVTLECAGNGRRGFHPPASGEPWDLGAVSTARFAGHPLAALWDRVGIQSTAIEVVFAGADGFTRSLPREVATSGEVMLVTAINGRPLPAEQGGPLRLLVPGWYGMAAVKWLSRISAVAEPFRGRFQAEKYVIEGRPVRHIEVRAVIAQPAPGSIVRPGADVMLRGYAWSGRAPVEAVEVDAGEGWQRARLLDGEHRFAWRRWELPWRAPDTPGEVTVRCRARDAGGATQPEEVAWNALGYANNSIRPHPVRVLPLPSGPGRRPA